MLKYPALLLALIVGGWLMRREIRRRPSVSMAIWIPTALVMVLGSRPLSSWISGGGQVRSATLLDQVFLLLALGAPLIIGSIRGVNWGKFLAANMPLLLLYAYFAATAIWSQDPAGSAIRIVKDFGLLFVVGLIYSEKEPVQAMRTIFIRCACILFPLSIVFNRWFPNFGRDFGMGEVLMHTGVTTQKNSLGEIVWVFSTFIVWDYIDSIPPARRKGLLQGMPLDYVALLLMGVVLLNESQSKTSLICLAIVAALSMRKGALASGATSAAAFAICLATPFLLFSSKMFGDVIAPIVNALGRDMTFTGRTNIWDHINATTVNPIIGCGYWTFWQGPGGLEISKEINWPIPTAHCGYLDLYLDGGILGLTVFFFALVAYGWRFISRKGVGRSQLVGLAMLCAAIIYNLTESSFVRLGPLWFATLLMIVAFPQRRKSTAVVKSIYASRIQASPEISKSIVARREWA